MYAVKTQLGLPRIIDAKPIPAIGGPRFGYFVLVTVDDGREDILEGEGNLTLEEANRLSKEIIGKSAWGMRKEPRT